MATLIWKGDAVAGAQESRATPANVGTADVFTLTCAGEGVSYTASTGDTVADVCAGLEAAWNASTVPEHTEITASDQTTYLKLLGDTAGAAFTVTGAATDGDSTDTQTLVMSTPTKATGPKVWDDPDNWSSGAIPANSDDVIIENFSGDILYDLSQGGVTLDSLTIRSTFTGKIGLPRVAAAAAHKTGVASYVEYRTAYLTIGATAVDIGDGAGIGSGRIKLDNSSLQTTLHIKKTGTAIEQNVPALLWKGTHVANAAYVTRGDMGAAYFGGETAVLATVDIGYESAVESDASVKCGYGTTLTTITKNGGSLLVASNTTTVTQTAGDLTIRGNVVSATPTPTCTTLTIDGGRCFYESAGTITTLSVAGEVDFRRDQQSRTVTNCSAYSGFAIRDPKKTVTWTNGIDLQRCRPIDGTLDIGSHQTLTPGSI